MIPYLETFVAVARYGSFVVTGDRLGLTAAAVSTQMRRLEESLNTTLFDRSGRSVVLNETGWRVLAHAEKIMQMYGEIEQGIADEKLIGHIRVGAIQTELLSSVVRAMPLFLDQYPQVDIHLTPGKSIELVEQVAQHTLDCAIIVKPTYTLDSTLKWQSIRQEPFVLIAAKHKKKKDIADMLANNRFIRYDRLSNGGVLVDNFLKQKQYSVNDVIEVDSIEAIGLMVANDVGVAILPKTLIFSACHIEVQEIVLGVDTFYREIGMVEYINNPRTHLIRGFSQALTAV